MVYRVYVEKREELAIEAKALLHEAQSFLGIRALEDVRIINRYDVENIAPEQFSVAVRSVLSEPQLDVISDSVDTDGYAYFVSEYLPGQFDQRADSAAQCMQMLFCGEKPLVKTAKVYLLKGALSEQEVEKIKSHVINPVESREASMAEYETLTDVLAIPTEVAVLDGFLELDEQGMVDMVRDMGLAMDVDDLRTCRDYFRTENRNPTITEIRVLDTYWSDHCRHTTFLTTIDSVSFEDELLQQAYERYLAARKEIGRTKPINLMDIGTIAARCLTARGQMQNLDESEEVNACTVKINVRTEAGDEKWLLLFKNETHNHPTEIEPFGGAATCVGGAIRDPLSGRAYVYAAMRVTGAADPLRPVEETLRGKLPQKKIVTTAASGYSSYGNQIGLATGMVDELYHDGYLAKRMEIGAVIAAAPQENVRRECPAPGDIVILLGGRTGRDGCGGATGSSKSHNVSSLESCGAEVQKGNAPEERKIQRLFRNPEATRLIKRCNDFGAGGVSVAIGELADGLCIDLNSVPKKYQGLDGTEIAISESQERMAVVVAKEDAERFLALAEGENLEATIVAEVTEEPRLVMHWGGKTVVDISREFLGSNGAEKHISVEVAAAEMPEKAIPEDLVSGMKTLAGDLNVCSRKGLSERFDSTIGAGTVLMPFGGKYQLTPIQAMVHKVSVEKKHTDTCSAMSWGYNPYVSEVSPYHGAYLAVVESVSKLVATGAEFKDVYLTFQEYFEKLGREPRRWGKPFAALLGALDAQLGLGTAAIGGKDSMSGSFEEIHVPPTLVSFAVTTLEADETVSPELKTAGSKLYLLKPEKNENGLPDTQSLLALFARVTDLMRAGKVKACYTPGYGGVAEAVLKMALGNGLGVQFADVSAEELFAYCYGGFVVETGESLEDAVLLGTVTEKPEFCFGAESVALAELQNVYETKLESVYSCNIEQSGIALGCAEAGAPSTAAPVLRVEKPTVVIPVFPGTNCEYDSAKAFEDAGAKAKIQVINNLSAEGILRSADELAAAIRDAQMIFIPGGFSGGDEPDGSAKFITAFFRNAAIRDAVGELLDVRGGLVAGICNGFQALIKLGLLPYGKIMDIDAGFPTLTYNIIGRHQSKIVRTRIASNMSPWLRNTKVGEIYSVPISHGEGRFYADEKTVAELNAAGQIATQYVDLEGNPSADIRYNPNGSAFAIEGITSADGRVFGKMGHSERIGSKLYRNVPGVYDMKMMQSAVEYFRK
ncbi:MAG: phosphoribosylformylglycinamidine synthase [Oscillospiraceae bacterium]|nr:phosphoribosylformylglycinamidine synthase [Oscillospiraceae bacterium]